MPEKTNKTAREKVLEKQPMAFVDDTNGRWVRIRVRETENTKCSECGRDYTRNKIPFACEVLGGAGNEAMAWENAARNLGLM